MTYRSYVISGSAFLLAFAVVSLPCAVHGYHDWRSDSTRCLSCHTSLPLLENQPLSFHGGISAICNPCHIKNHESGETEFSHPVEVKASFPLPQDMPLDKDGNMTCISCHFYHLGKESIQAPHIHLLRRPLNEKFCFYCHASLS